MPDPTKRFVDESNMAAILAEAKNRYTNPSASDSAPSMDGTASAGTSATYSRSDHVHPTDTSRAPLDSPQLTGTPKAPTPTAGDSTTKLATTAFVQSAVSDPTRESTGEVSGPLLGVSAEGWATQEATTGKNLLPKFANATSNGITFAVMNDGSVIVNGTASNITTISVSTSLGAGTYALSGCPSGNTGLAVDANRQPYSADTGSGVSFTLSEQETVQFRIRIASGVTCNNLTFYPQLELGSTATSYEPYTGGAPAPSPDWPQSVVCATGRNLWDAESYPLSEGRFIDATNGNSGPLTGCACTDGYLPCGSFAGRQVTLNKRPNGDNTGVAFYTSSKSYISGVKNANGTAGTKMTFDVPANAEYLRFTAKGGETGVQLELGSTPSPYVPYGHVGMEVRDSQDALLSCTPIPLPPRGWVAGLPDGTADKLALDVAGKVTWEEKTNVEAFDGSSDESWVIGNTNKRASITSQLPLKPTASSYTQSNGFASHFRTVTPSNTWNGQLGFAINNTGSDITFADGTNAMTVEAWTSWLSTHPVTVLYPLATPITEDCGYVDMPDIPGEAVVSIPELAALGVEWSLSRVVRSVAEAYRDRIVNELGAAVTELAGRVAAIENAS